MILFWEDATFFRSAWIFSNRVILCPLFSQLHSSPPGATALFPVGQKAEPGVVTQTSWFIELVRETQIWTHDLYIFTFCGKVPLVPFTSWRQFPSCLWGVDESQFVSELAEGWVPVAVGARGSPVPQPAPLPHALLCAMLSVGLHICTRKEFLRKSLHMHHLAIFCTDRRRELRVLQHKWRTSEWRPHTRPSRGHGDLANTTGVCGYDVSGDTCVVVFKSACLTSQSNPFRFVVLSRLAIFSSAFLPFYHIYFLDYYARVVLKLKVSCLISSY